MTIAMIVHCPPYSLVAADRRWTIWERGKEKPSGHSEETDFRDVVTGQEWRGPHVKVRAHPTLPLVWVSAGIGFLKYQGEDWAVNDLISVAFPDSATEISMAGLKFLSPLVAQTRKQRLEILIGSGLGALHVQYLGDSSSEHEITDGYVVASAHTQAFIDSVALADKFPRPGSTPSKIARHMRHLLRRALKAAQDLAGDEADVGGQIDVAIAGPHGARIFTE